MIKAILSDTESSPEAKAALIGKLIEAQVSPARVLFEDPPSQEPQLEPEFDPDPSVNVTTSEEENYEEARESSDSSQEYQDAVPAQRPKIKRRPILGPQPKRNLLREHFEERKNLQDRLEREAETAQLFERLPLSYPIYEGPEFILPENFHPTTPFVPLPTEIDQDPPQEHQVEMNPPTYSGYNPTQDSIIDFLDDLERYLTITNVPIDRQERVIVTLLKEPAKSIFRNTPPTLTVTAADDAAADIRTTNQATRVQELKDWLRNTFFGEDVRQTMADKIHEAFQLESESPQQFYQRISLLVDNSAIPDDHREYTIESQYFTGLQPAVRFHVKMFGMGLDFAGKRTHAQHFWQNRQGAPPPDIDISPQQLYRQEPNYQPRQVTKKISNYEDQLEKLTTEMAQLRIQLANQGRPPRTPNYRNFGKPENVQNNQACFKCGEVGHFANQCMAETPRKAQGRREAANIATFNKQEVFIDESDEEYENEEDEPKRFGTYPAVAKPREVTKPYTRESRHSKKNQQARPENNVNRDMEVDLSGEPASVREVPRSESAKENVQRQRNTRQHTTDFWDEIKDTPITLPLQKILNISPQARTQLRAGLSPKFPTNSANPEDKEEEYSAAYLTVAIDGKLMTAVVDTGASVPIMTKEAMLRLEYEIERPSTAVIITANNEDVPILGEVDDVTFCIGNASFTSNFMIIPDGDYDILLSLKLLQKMQALIDTSNNRMRFTCKGKTYDVDLNCNRPSSIRRHRVNNLGYRLTEKDKQHIKKWQDFAKNPPAFPKETPRLHKVPILEEYIEIPNHSKERLSYECGYIETLITNHLHDLRVTHEMDELAKAINTIFEYATNISIHVGNLNEKEKKKVKEVKTVRFSIPEYTSRQPDIPREEPEVPASWEERVVDNQNTIVQEEDEEDDIYPPGIFWDVHSDEQKQSYEWQLKNTKILLTNGTRIDPEQHNSQTWSRKNRFHSLKVQQEDPIWYYEGRTYYRGDRCSSTHCKRNVTYEVSVQRDDEINETDEHGVCHVCVTDWTCLGQKIVGHTIWGTWDRTCKNISQRASKENALRDSTKLPEELIETIGEGTTRIPTGLKPVLRQERERQRYHINAAGFKRFVETKQVKSQQYQGLNL